MPPPAEPSSATRENEYFVPNLGDKPGPNRIGLIVLSSDMITERDFGLMTPRGGEICYYSTRVPLEIPVTEGNLRRMGPQLSEAASLILPTTHIDVIAYSCTSASVLIGPEEVTAQIQKGRPGAQVVTPILAAIAAFEASNIKRITLLTPYTLEITAAMGEFIESQGTEVLNQAYFGLLDDQDMARLKPETIHDAVVDIVHEDADAVFVSCTGVRTVETIERLESTLNKPVFCSNQCMFWQSLRLSGYDKPVTGFGQLLLR
ncbi:Asp/Glu/Hydantoin racemase family protein [Roseobacter sp. SK209-2-6]|uniref:maleate cis-trans isomerase family protein n=1 Tax=Roseobacter sp. SK209-2-6 TaxID=388739 RepID=UPI0000F3EC8C|nr:aspartate/glutamate racemase family protein [Roseobacter sp. SK209-2-6]EBA16797.1 Asp/Glu/Hydantoin racemase family protein [Roseobacter sp. SK209-2-6]